MGDQSVEEAVGAAGVVALGLCALDLAMEVAGGLLVDVVLVVVFVEVGWMVVSTGIKELDATLIHTVLVVHGKLALQLLSDAGHVCFCCVVERCCLSGDGL